MGFEDPNSCTHTSGYVTAQRCTNGYVCVRGQQSPEKDEASEGAELKIRVSNFQ